MRPETAAGQAALRLGIVGAGPWGRILAATADRLAGLTVARVVTSREGWRAAIEDASLDGLLVAAPAGLHGEIARAAAERELPVFVEKPLALSVEDARRVQEAATARGVPVMVDHVHLFSPAYAELNRRLAGCGGARAVRARSGDLGPFRADCPPLWDWGPHDVALSLDLAGGPPETVKAERIRARRMGSGLEERWRIALGFPGGLGAGIETGNDVSPKTRWLAVECGDGTYVYDDCAADKLTLTPPDSPAVPVACAVEPPLDRALAAFAAAIRDGDAAGEARRSLSLAVAVVETLAACEAAAGLRSGAAVP